MNNIFQRTEPGFGRAAAGRRHLVQTPRHVGGATHWAAAARGAVKNSEQKLTKKTCFN